MLWKIALKLLAKIKSSNKKEIEGDPSLIKKKSEKFIKRKI